MEWDWNEVNEALVTSWHALLLWANIGSKLGLMGLNVADNNRKISAIVLLILITIFLVRRFLHSAFLRRILASLSLLSRRLQDRYNVIIQSLAYHSRIVAYTLPHILFLLVSLYVQMTFPSIADAMNSEELIWAFAIPMPMILSILALRVASDDSVVGSKSVQGESGIGEPSSVVTNTPVSSQYVQETVKSWLKYFSILNLLYFLLNFPIVYHTTLIIPYFHVVKALFFWWTMFPFLGAIDIIHNVLRPILAPWTALIPKEFDKGFFNTFLNVLVLSHVITVPTKTKIVQLLHGGFVALISLPFLGTFGLITRIGGDVVSIAMPVCLSLASPDRDSDRRWLTYWIVKVVVSSLEMVFYGIISSIPFYNHARILFFLWLQLPYFSGAMRIFHAVINSSHIVGSSGNTDASAGASQEIEGEKIVQGQKAPTVTGDGDNLDANNIKELKMTKEGEESSVRRLTTTLSMAGTVRSNQESGLNVEDGMRIGEKVGTHEHVD